MNAATRKPRTIRPALAAVVTYRRMVYPCTLIPAGQVAHIALNGKPYVCSHVEGDTYRIHSATDTYTVTPTTCTCADFTFVREARGEVCKHVTACRQMKQDGTI